MLPVARWLIGECGADVGERVGENVGEGEGAAEGSGVLQIGQDPEIESSLLVLPQGQSEDTTAQLALKAVAPENIAPQLACVITLLVSQLPIGWLNEEAW